MPADTKTENLSRNLNQILDKCPLPQDAGNHIVHRICRDLSLKNLSRVGRELDEFITALANTGIRIEKALQAIGQLYDAATCRIIEVVEGKISRTVNLAAPVPYCWINMGSAARYEQVFGTDQDNALIFSSPDPGVSTRTHLFFEMLATFVNEALEAFGFKKCRGGVMASNPEWRHSLPEWLKTLESWTGDANPKGIRNLTIFLDFSPVYGDPDLAGQLHRKVFKLFHEFPGANHYLVRDDRSLELPGDITGNRRQRQPFFNIKTGGIVHMVNYIRILAVNNRITMPSTLDRLKALRDSGKITAAEYETYHSAFCTLMAFKLTHLSQKRGDKGTPENCIDLSALSGSGIGSLNSALRAARKLKKIVHDTYDLAWLNYFS